MAYTIDDADAAYYLAMSQGGGSVNQLSRSDWEEEGDDVFAYRDSDGIITTKVKFLDGDGNAAVRVRGGKTVKINIWDARPEADEADES